MTSNIAQRLGTIGLTVGAVVGGLVGLVIGLRHYAPTAWAAMFEVGIPAAVLGGCLGLVAAGGVTLVHRLHH